MADKNVEMARCVARAVEQSGGRTYYVGGFVRDRLLGKDSKDVDIEVHGIDVRTLETILDGLGERLAMGASFGVMGLRHYDLDIAMPRSERAIGGGHRDFDVVVDPFIGQQGAARRRDFTINALMEDVLTGELLDFFGGKDDLAHGRIRHVDPATFVEDPLRVLRAAQFAARFGFEVDSKTRVLCSTMDLTALPGERVFGELEKALLKASRPSVFFDELRLMDQLGIWFAEVEALVGVPQNVAYHPEGDVWTHTLQVLDCAAEQKEEACYPLGLLLASVCHDLGKAAVLQEVDGIIHAYGHEKEGVPLARRLLGRLTREQKLVSYVLNMVELHMRPNQLVINGSRAKSYMRLFDVSACPEDLLLLAKADHEGRASVDGLVVPEDYAPTEERLRRMLAEYHRRMAQPHATGKDLVQAGFAPGPAFGEALNHAHKLRLAGRPKEEQIAAAVALMRKIEGRMP